MKWIALFIGVAGCTPSSMNVCKDLQKDGVVDECEAATPPAGVSYAKESTSFTISSTRGRANLSGFVLTFKSEGDYNNAVNAYTGLRPFLVKTSPRKKAIVVLPSEAPGGDVDRIGTVLDR